MCFWKTTRFLLENQEYFFVTSPRLFVLCTWTDLAPIQRNHVGVGVFSADRAETLPGTISDVCTNVSYETFPLRKDHHQWKVASTRTTTASAPNPRRITSAWQQLIQRENTRICSTPLCLLSLQEACFDKRLEASATTTGRGCSLLNPSRTIALVRQDPGSSLPLAPYYILEQCKPSLASPSSSRQEVLLQEDGA